MIQVISAITGLATTWLQGRAEESKAKQQVKIAQQQAKARVIEQEADWEKIMAQGSATSWKDEWFVVVLSIPLIGAFYPDAVQYIHAGFEALSATPEWYQWSVLAAISASFGLRGIAKFKK